ncbi:MAG: hypothetical protein ACRDDH_18070 [Cetobacterium sp.]|uniref:hypothetical protein n=1 Tax=Cetobacterium sp. TaxID=2071632 RepID=UPI003EE793BD
MSSHIPKKFMESLKLEIIQQIDVGALVKEDVIEEYFEGAVFPLSGTDTKMVLEGFYKIGTMKLYTYKDIVDNPKEKKYHKVVWKGKKYQLTNKKEWHTDKLKTYLMEILE